MEVQRLFIEQVVFLLSKLYLKDPHIGLGVY